MILSLLLALQTPAAAPGADRPIRIWMDAQGPVSRGRGVRLYVQAGAAGSLVVLHSRSDGRIEVLFPARPTEDPHVTPGTWEVRGKGDGPVWTVSEPDGTGMILAALTPDPVWFDEFSHAASWDQDALRPSWSGADASGGMTDIVQRMLGDGAFTYDVLTYTVAPDAIAQGGAPMSGLPGAADAQDTALNPPTIDSTEPDNAALTTCGVSSPVECQLLGQPLFFGPHHRGFGRGTPAPVAAAPQTRAMAAPLVYPIRPTPLTQTAVVPGHRMIPNVGGRSRLTPSASSSAPAAPAIHTLVGRPVAGASSGRLAGAAPAARSALVLRYVRPRSAVTPAAPTTVATLTSSSAIPGASAPATALPLRGGGRTGGGISGGGVALLSRPVSGRMAVARASGAVAARPRMEARAPAIAAPRTGGVSGGWMAMPRRR